MKVLLVLLAASISIFANVSNTNPSEKGTTSIHGRILDAENAEALTGASVYFVELDLRVYASLDGSFTIDKVSLGTYTVEVSYISYETVVYENFEVSGEKSYKKFLL